MTISENSTQFHCHEPGGRSCLVLSQRRMNHVQLKEHFTAITPKTMIRAIKLRELHLWKWMRTQNRMRHRITQVEIHPTKGSVGADVVAYVWYSTTAPSSGEMTVVATAAVMVAATRPRCRATTKPGPPSAWSLVTTSVR